MNVIAKLFCVVCMMLCAACESGTTDGGNGSTTYGKDKTIGHYTIHNFMGDNPSFVGKDGLTGTATVAKNANAYLAEAKTYTKDLADKFEKSLEGRPAAKKYFSSVISTIQNNNYFHINESNPGGQNFDSAVEVNAYPGNPIFTDIIKNLSNTDERDAFEICYRILANEAYKEGLGNYRTHENIFMNYYNDEKGLLISDSLSNEEFSKHNINLENIYKQNDLKKFTPITDLTDVLLDKFVKKMNAKQNLGLQVSDMQQFINISLTLNSLGAMHDYSKSALNHKGCTLGNGLGFYVNTMQNASHEAWKEEQQYQQLYQDYMSR